MLPQSLMGLALAKRGSVVELPGMGFVGHRGSFQQFLTEVTPEVPTTTKPGHANPIHRQMWQSVASTLSSLFNFHAGQNLYRLSAQQEMYSVVWAWIPSARSLRCAKEMRSLLNPTLHKNYCCGKWTCLCWPSIYSFHYINENLLLSDTKYFVGSLSLPLSYLMIYSYRNR